VIQGITWVSVQLLKATPWRSIGRCGPHDGRHPHGTRAAYVPTDADARIALPRTPGGTARRTRAIVMSRWAPYAMPRRCGRHLLLLRQTGWYRQDRPAERESAARPCNGCSRPGRLRTIDVRRASPRRRHPTDGRHCSVGEQRPAHRRAAHPTALPGAQRGRLRLREIAPPDRARSASLSRSVAEHPPSPLEPRSPLSRSTTTCSRTSRTQRVLIRVAGGRDRRRHGRLRCSGPSARRSWSPASWTGPTTRNAAPPARRLRPARTPMDPGLILSDGGPPRLVQHDVDDIRPSSTTRAARVTDVCARAATHGPAHGHVV